MSTPDYAVEVEGLTKKYGSLTAVDALSLTITPGQIYGLLGPNGAGKSTLIKMLTTLLPPTAGRAKVAGFDVTRQGRQVRESIGYVPQMISADGGLTARENLVVSARLYGVPGKVRPARIEEVLGFMNLTEVGDRMVRTFSGGMIRRLEMAQAMLHQPRVLFLDEPTVGLDPTAKTNVWDRLLALRANLRMTILLTTHDMEEADTLCDALAVLHQGKIAAQGTLQALKDQVGPEADLKAVFTHFSGGAQLESGNFRDVRHTRQTAHRLG